MPVLGCLWMLGTGDRQPRRSRSCRCDRWLHPRPSSQTLRQQMAAHPPRGSSWVGESITGICFDPSFPVQPRKVGPSRAETSSDHVSHCFPTSTIFNLTPPAQLLMESSISILESPNLVGADTGTLPSNSNWKPAQGADFPGPSCQGVKMPRRLARIAP